MTLAIAPPRVLLVEDNPADARLVAELLDGAGAPFALRTADRVAAALPLLAAERFAVVLVDLGLPDARGMQALDAVRAAAGGAPVVVWSGSVDEEVAREARSHGARDVLLKGTLDGAALAAALRIAVEAAAFEAAVANAIVRATDLGEPVGVLRVVVEGWQELVAGRPVEESAALTHAVAERLGGRLATEDGLHALGGGRFGIVAEGLRHGDDAEALGAELTRAFARPVAVGGEPVALQVRIGLVFAPAGPAPPVAPVPARDERGDLAERLQRAIREGHLVLHYQPLVRLGDDAIPVMEALVRWDDPEHGLLSPAAFIPLAEETGLIEEIGAWALAEACRQLRTWDDLGLPRVRCAVNLSARELCSPQLPARVADALVASGLTPDRLELELTESMFADPEETATMLARLRAIGVRVAIDDFGTGYSSLGYLTRFAVDVIKVDGSFVRRAALDEDAAEVVRAIVGIAHQLRLEVVAEGVETLEQLAFVRDRGCDLVQGFLFCRPLGGDEAGSWLAWANERVAERDALAATPSGGTRRLLRRRSRDRASAEGAGADRPPVLLPGTTWTAIRSGD